MIASRSDGNGGVSGGRLGCFPLRTAKPEPLPVVCAAGPGATGVVPCRADCSGADDPGSDGVYGSDPYPRYAEPTAYFPARLAHGSEWVLLPVRRFQLDHPPRHYAHGHRSGFGYMENDFSAPGARVGPWWEPTLLDGILRAFSIPFRPTLICRSVLGSFSLALRPAAIAFQQRQPERDGGVMGPCRGREFRADAANPGPRHSIFWPGLPCHPAGPSPQEAGVRSSGFGGSIGGRPRPGGMDDSQRRPVLRAGGDFH